MRSTNRSLLSAVVCLGLVAVFVRPALGQSDSQVGVWKLNVEKSTQNGIAAKIERAVLAMLCATEADVEGSGVVEVAAEVECR